MTGNFSDSELSLISDFISSRFGLFFPREMWKILEKNLSSAASELGYRNINDFIQLVISSRVNEEEIKILVTHLTVTETYFWREPSVFSALMDSILPGIINSKKKKEKSLRIWSAGCSTGEEPYSIGIALHNSIPQLKEWKVSILATDINEKALDKARLGVYNAWSFRTSPSWLKTRYFVQKSNMKFEIIKEIKDMVIFSSSNLMEDKCYSAVQEKEKMDIIFCRNVIMYFSPEKAGEISYKLFQSLDKNGWLIVSSFELSSRLFPGFTPVRFQDAIVYSKSKWDSNQSFNLHQDDIRQTFNKPSGPVFNYGSGIMNPQPHQTISTSTLQPSQHIQIDSFDNRISSIRLLANQGHLSEALASCNKVLSSNKLLPGLYFLRSSILQEMNKGYEAIRSLKQAIYIDPDYIMGHFILGTLYFQQGNIKSAEQYYHNTLELLSKKSNGDIPDESEGLSAEYIREIVLANLNIQKSG